jgi:hypothetical protein
VRVLGPAEVVTAVADGAATALAGHAAQGAPLD